MAIKTEKVMMLKCVLLDANIIIESQVCSSDGPAIQALAMIGHSNAGISMETLLKKTGLQKGLEHQFCDEFFKKHIKKGSENYIQGAGIANR